MCTRYYLESSPELKPYTTIRSSSLQHQMVSHLARPLKTEGEVFPTNIVPVIAPSRKSLTPTVFPMVWGFTNPRSGSPVLNCRVETAGEKPFWKEAWNRRRCVIPASWYYEWEHFSTPDGKKRTGQKYMIQPKGSAITFLAGLYAFEENNGITFPVFSVLTKEPAESIIFIHDRMPVILPKEGVGEWLMAGKMDVVEEMVFEKV